MGNTLEYVTDFSTAWAKSAESGGKEQSQVGKNGRILGRLWFEDAQPRRVGPACYHSESIHVAPCPRNLVFPKRRQDLHVL